MASPSRRPADFEFDPPTIAWPPEDELNGYRKVVVNPFLAVMALVGWHAAMQSSFIREMPLLALLGSTSLLAALPFLVHYHCLDCGRTGILPLCKRHACSGVVARWRRARRPRVGWPRPGTQMVVWVWLIGSAAVLIAVRQL